LKRQENFSCKKAHIPVGYGLFLSFFKKNQFTLFTKKFGSSILKTKAFFLVSLLRRIGITISLLESE